MQSFRLSFWYLYLNSRQIITFQKEYLSPYNRETKYFTCTCQRCSDSTELGTEFSSLRCPNSCTGYLSAMSPTAPDDELSSCLWECKVCKKTEVAGGYVDKVIRSIGEELVRLERGVPEACINFIKKHSQNLHPNHYYLVGWDCTHYVLGYIFWM